MHSSLKYTSMFLLGTVLGAVLTPAKVQLLPATEVYKEVAHIDPSVYPNATLIYTDVDSDTSYYVANERMQSLSKGDAVVFDNDSIGRVKDVCLRGVYVDISEADMQAGMSGTPVWCNGEIIGYVSSLQDSTTLYCIWAN